MTHRLHVVHLDRGDGYSYCSAYCRANGDRIADPPKCRTCLRRTDMPGVLLGDQGEWKRCGNRMHFFPLAGPCLAQLVEPTEPSTCIQCTRMAEAPEIAAKLEAVRELQDRITLGRLASQKRWPEDFGKIPSRGRARRLGTPPPPTPVEKRALEKLALEKRALRLP